MTDKPELTVEQVDAEDVKWMCEAAIGLNRAWSRARAEQLRDLALRALSSGVAERKLPVKMIRLSLTDPEFDSDLDIYQHGWNAAIDAMLAAAPASTEGRGDAPWQMEAYAKLGAVRDHMTPEAVTIVQDFIWPIPSAVAKERAK